MNENCFFHLQLFFSDSSSQPSVGMIAGRYSDSITTKDRTRPQCVISERSEPRTENKIVMVTDISRMKLAPEDLILLLP